MRRKTSLSQLAANQEVSTDDLPMEVKPNQEDPLAHVFLFLVYFWGAEGFKAIDKGLFRPEAPTHLIET